MLEKNSSKKTRKNIKKEPIKDKTKKKPDKKINLKNAINDIKNDLNKDKDKILPDKSLGLKKAVKPVKTKIKKNKKGFDKAEIEGKDESTILEEGTKKNKKGFDVPDIAGTENPPLLKKKTKSKKMQDWKAFDKFKDTEITSTTKLNQPETGNLKNLIKNIRQELQHDLGFHKMQGSLEEEKLSSKEKKQLLKQRKPFEKALKGVEFSFKEKGKTYLRTGVPGFDDLFETGIPVGSAILVAGGAGSGKTLMCLQILNNACKKGKKCLYMSFEESEKRLEEHMKDFGWDFASFEKKKLLYIKRFNPFDITRSVDALLEKAKGELMIDVNPVILPTGFQPDIIVVDSLTAIASAFTGAREASYRIYIEQLFRFLEQINATSFLITETEQMPKIFSQTGVEEFLADGVIVLYKIKRNSIRENAIEVLKLRGAGHQKKIVAMQITSEGVVVYPEQEVYMSDGDK